MYIMEKIQQLSDNLKINLFLKHMILYNKNKKSSDGSDIFFVQKSIAVLKKKIKLADQCENIIKI